MGRLPVDALEPGMVLASDLLGSDGKLLLPKGMALTDGLIASLRKRGVPGAEIDTGFGGLDGPALDDYPLIPAGGTPLAAISSLFGTSPTVETVICA